MVLNNGPSSNSMVNHWYHLDQCRLVDRGLCFDRLSLDYLLLLHLFLANYGMLLGFWRRA